MRHLKLAGAALMVAAASSAVLAGSAFAKAPKLHLTWNDTKNPLVAGDEFKMADEGAFTVSTSSGSVTCTAGAYPEEQGFYGEDLTNNAKTDKLELAGSYGLIAGSYCPSGVPLASSAYTAVLPWQFVIGTLSLSTNHKATVKAPKKMPDTVFLGFSGGPSCFYTFTKLAGSWAGTYAEALHMSMSFNDQKLKFQKEISGALCPKQATVSAAFAYQLTTQESVPWDVFAEIF